MLGTQYMLVLHVVETLLVVRLQISQLVLLQTIQHLLISLLVQLIIRMQ